MGGVFRFVPSPVSGPAYFELVGSDGVRRWSTLDKIFRVTDVLQGTKSFTSRSTPINSVTTSTIGSCNTNANFVLGYMKVTTSLQAGQLSPFPTDGDWFYVSGSYTAFAGGGADLSLCSYTFTASGGTVSLEEELAIYIVKNDVGQTFNFPAFTLTYELWVGTFA